VALASRWLLTRLSPRPLNPVWLDWVLLPGRPGELRPEPPTGSKIAFLMPEYLQVRLGSQAGHRPQMTDPDVNLSIRPARATLKLAESPSDPLQRKLRQLRCLHYRLDCYRVERTSSRGRDRAEARALDQERSSHVSSGPPAIPEGRISRFRFWPWLSPVRSSRDRWSLSARSHAPQPTSVYPAAVLKFMAPPIFVVGHVRTPSAQSSFA